MMIAVAVNLLLQLPGGGYAEPDWESESTYTYPFAHAVPDLDQDGWEDWLIEDRSITLRSGDDGSDIWHRPDSVLNRLRVVDFESDGDPELIYGSFYNSDAKLVRLDPTSGDVIWEARASADPGTRFYTIELHDLDGDGTPEILASNQFLGSGPDLVVAVFDLNGNEWWSARLAQGGARRSTQFVDVNGDGVVEILITNPDHRSGFDQLGQVRLVDARSGAILWTQLGSAPGSNFGEEACVADLDGNGIAEVLVFSPDSSSQGLIENGLVACFDAQGRQLWSMHGDKDRQRLGSAHAIGDADRDGQKELFLGSANYGQNDGLVQALDAMTGAELYRLQDWLAPKEYFGGRVFFQEGTAQTNSWLVVLAERVANSNDRVSGVDFRDAATGQLIHREPYQVYGGTFRGEVSIDDLDQNGEPEVYIRFPSTQGGGKCGVITPSDGVLWEEKGDSAGTALVRLSAAGSVPARVIYSAFTDQPGAPEAGRVVCRRASDGHVLWSQAGSIANGQLGSTIEVLERSGGTVPRLWIGTPGDGPQGARIHRSDSGELVAAFPVTDGPATQPGDTRYALSWNAASSADPRVLVVNRNRVAQYSDTSPEFTFISSKQTKVSRSQGADFQLELDFTQECAWWEYRVMCSGHGIGESGLDNEIVVPLTYDRLYAWTAAGSNASAWIPEARGSLNAYGKKSVRVNIKPQRLPAGFVGRSLAFAAAAREPLGSWEFCSTPIQVRVLP